MHINVVPGAGIAFGRAQARRERSLARAATVPEQNYTMNKIRDSDENSNINTYKTEVNSRRIGEKERII
jgi:hypothetical protein